VPITLQTLAVLLAGILLGKWWGGISLAIYAMVGTAGVPWFNGWKGGVDALAGPTGGYVIGFIFAALFLGYFTDRYIRARSFLSTLPLMLFANFLLVYVPGLGGLYIWLNLAKGMTLSVYQLLAMGLLPFIAGDVLKIVAAAALARVITPKQAYGNEVDRDKLPERLP
jgi:biotin transport system substrate-specific component